MMDSTRTMSKRHVTRNWLGAWLGAAVLGVGNGIVRNCVYQDRVGARAAHYISTAALLVALAGYTRLLERLWPIPTRRSAICIGGTWTALTVLFEFGLGRAVAHEPWAKLLEQYDITRGNVWILVPLLMAIGPELTRRFSSGRALVSRTPAPLNG